MLQPQAQAWNMSAATSKHGIKRKNIYGPENTLVAPPPEKHFVTEEEMTMEMRRLQIVDPANPYQHYHHPPPYNLTPFAFNAEGQFNGFGIEHCPNDSDGCPNSNDSSPCESVQEASLPRLYVDQEVFKIQPEPLVPFSLLRSFPRDQFAVVPWVPPVLPDNKEEETSTPVPGDDDVMDMDIMC